METVQVDDGRVVREWTGELIARTATGHEARWAEFEIWRTERGGYVVHRIGQSRVYHRADTPCSTQTGRPPGVPGTVDDLPDDALPCRYCRPPAPLDLAGDEPVRVEVARHTINQVADPARAVAVLTVHRDRISQRRRVVVSEPVAELLDIAARNDPAFRGVPRPVEKIT